MFLLFHYANQSVNLVDLSFVPKNNPENSEIWTVCQENFIKKHSHEEEKIIYFVTPTYERFEQIPELTRLVQTLIHVKEVLHWIVAIDGETCPKNVVKLLRRFPEISYTLISAPTPKMFKVGS